MLKKTERNDHPVVRPQSLMQTQQQIPTDGSLPLNPQTKSPERLEGSMSRKITATELVEERANCNFDQRDLAMGLYGPDIMQLIASCQQDMKDHPAIANKREYYEMTPAEKQFMWFKKLHYIWFNMPEKRELYFNPNNIRFQWFFLHKGISPFYYHWTMLRYSIDVCASDAQKEKWVPLLESCDFMGCYAQTELGHGSDVQGIETTATYDRLTDQFVVHTPSPRATKWWPGDLGRTANHALVVARVQVKEDDGEVSDYGLGMFIVQVRDQDTHRHMQGIKSGEIGPKFGYSSKDNGWVTFDQVRIPRENMLSKLMEIDEDGCFQVKGDPRLVYSTMLITRCMIINGSWSIMLMACTIAVRYSLVRRQFRNISGQDEETKLLDYQTQQMKLFSVIAVAQVHSAGADYVNNLLEQMRADFKQNNFKLLEVMHHLTTGMKSLYTQRMIDGMTQIRQALGGAGYSAWSGIPALLDDFSPTVTFEGDNTVMAQQSFNFLLKIAQKIVKRKGGREMHPIFKYLEKLYELDLYSCNAKSVDDFLDIDQVEEAIQIQICHRLKKIMAKRTESSASKKDFVNSQYGLDIVTIALDHIWLVSMTMFRSRIEANADFPLRTLKDPKNKENMLNICLLYGLLKLNEDSHELFQSGYFSDKEVPYSDLILEAIKTVNLRLRPQMLSILESLPFSDDTLKSAIGNSYGDIYETHLEWAKGSRLNQNEDAIPDGYMEYMAPILKAKM